MALTWTVEIDGAFFKSFDKYWAKYLPLNNPAQIIAQANGGDEERTVARDLGKVMSAVSALKKSGKGIEEMPKSDVLDRVRELRIGVWTVFILTDAGSRALVTEVVHEDDLQ